MKTRFVSTLVLAIVLCAFAAMPAFAGYDEPFVEWEDVGLAPSFSHAAVGAASYVRNGAFDEWAGGEPVGWSGMTYERAGELHWAKIDWADQSAKHEGRHNYGLGLFALCNSAEAPGYGIAYSALNIPTSGTYWVVAHATAWGEFDKNMAYNSPAWYAIYPSSNPADVPDSAWRELYPDPQVCENGAEVCNYLARAESVYIERGSYIFLKAEMKFPDYYGWTAWGFDDVAVWDMVGGGLWEPDTWVDDGDVTWNNRADR